MTASGPKPDAAPAEPDFRLVRLNGSYEGFGLVMDHLSRLAPFSGYDLGNFSAAIRDQLASGHHVAAVSGTRLAGYCGWLVTDAATAEGWIDGSGALVPRSDGGAAALTVVAAADRTILTALIRQARTLNPGARVYFKREYADPARQARKNAVANRE